MLNSGNSKRPATAAALAFLRLEEEALERLPEEPPLEAEAKAAALCSEARSIEPRRIPSYAARMRGLQRGDGEAATGAWTGWPPRRGVAQRSRRGVPPAPPVQMEAPS